MIGASSLLPLPSVLAGNLSATSSIFLSISCHDIAAAVDPLKSAVIDELVLGASGDTVNDAFIPASRCPDTSHRIS